MGSALRILHLEDDANDSELVRETLEAVGFDCRLARVDSGPEFEALLEQGGFDLILADNAMPGFDGLSALSLARARRPEVPFVFLSGTLDEEVAIESLKLGATDYVFKTKLSRLVPSVRRALSEAEERARRGQAERALLLSESYLLEAQRLSHTGSFGMDLSTGRIRWTEETFRIFDLDPGTTPTPELIVQLTHPEDRSVVEHAIGEAFRRQEMDFEHRLLLPNGTIKYLRVMGHKLDPEHLVGAVMDITESKRAEAERMRAVEGLRAREAELAHVARLMTMGEMAASIAHEVNQPLAAILLQGKACLRWLSGQQPDLAEARVSVERIVEDAARAGQVIARIRARARKAATEKVALDLKGAIEQVLVIARAELQRSRVSVRSLLPDGLPLVVADRVEIQQVLLNLIINASEAMSTVIGRPRVLEVSIAEHNLDNLLVAVQDTGVGLDPGNRERVFEAFYTTKPEGMGMGLSICHSIVQDHGGRLWAESNDGPGTTFRFTLPKVRR